MFKIAIALLSITSSCFADDNLVIEANEPTL